MARRGTIIAFSGAIGAGTGALSLDVAARLGWPHARFSDYIRIYATECGEDPSDRAVLQRLGQALVQEHLEHFVTKVLQLAGWQAGGNLILDGLRHAEVHVELRKRLGDGAHLHVVHIQMNELSRAARSKAAEGLEDDAFMLYDSHVTEAQIERVLPSYAELILDGDNPDQDPAELVLKRFGHPERPPDDRGEDSSLLEPLNIAHDSPRRQELANLATQLLAESKDFAGALPPSLRRPLADLVRSMNCYYSNLIEGHDTHPIDIERALREDYSADPEKRDLQLEAKAHIAVQTWIDDGGLGDRAATDQSALREVHERFCSELPDSLLWATNPTTNERWRVAPGEYRHLDAKVGRHVPPSPGALPRFMQRFEAAYGRLGKLDLILATAAAHHRLLWIHPFSDGNGRVARLMSHAMLQRAMDTHSIWSVARGLARSESEYKQLLTACDLTRRNDLDGRGHLSQETLSSFTQFFLERCIDQVRFMRGLMQPDELRARFRLWVEEQVLLDRLPSSAVRLVSALLAEGSLSRREADEILNVDGTKAEGAISFLTSEGMIAISGAEGRLGLAFPAKLANRLVPGLFP